MKKLFMLLALVLGVVSCQNEPEGFGVVVGGEQDVNITVSLPDETRADSAKGFDLNNLNGYKVRYILEISYNNRVVRDVQTAETTSVVFPVRLAPGRDYQFTVWADLVKEGQEDLYYNVLEGAQEGVSALSNITFKTWTPNTEARDAWTDTKSIKFGENPEDLSMTLTRPFAKVRVVATDLAKVTYFGITPKSAVAVYSKDMYTSFNAVAGKANTTNVEQKNHTFEYEDVDTYEDATGQFTVFTDYILVPADGTVQFNLEVKDANGGTIKSTNFNTQIPVERNKVTSIVGDVLTEGGNVNITVDGNLGVKETFTYISSGAQLIAQMNAGGNFILGNDITVTDADVATRAYRRNTENEPKKTTIDLNGYTITVKNTSENPLVTIAAGNTLFLEGGNIVLAEGSRGSFIKNNGGNVVLTNGTLENESNHNTAAVVEGKVIAEENATVNDDHTTTVENWLEDVRTNGGTYVFTEDIEAGQIKVTATAPVVLDGNGHTFTYNGSDRAIEIPSDATEANVTIKNLNIAFGASYCQRGINFNVTGGTLTIDNVKVSETGTAATYAINLPGSSDNATVTINNSYLRGNIALNVWGANMAVNATNTEFVSYDNTDVENYAAISVNNDGAGNNAEGTEVNITGGRIVALDEDGNNSYAVRNSTMTGVVNISESTEVIGTISNPVVAVIYEGYNEFYTFLTLQDAIDKVCEQNSGSVRLIKDIELSETVTIPAEETIVIDLNGKTITGPSAARDAEDNRIHVIVNNGSLTVNGEGLVKSVATNGGSAILSNGVLTLNNVTIEGAPSDTTTGNASYAVNTEGEGSKLVVNNSSISGRGAIGATNGTKVELNGGTYHTPAVAWGHAIYANGEGTEVVVNDGTFSEGYEYKNDIWGMYQIYSGNKAKVIVNGGDFSQPWDCANGYDLCTASEGTIEIYGGTFADDPSKQNGKNFVAEGYYASKNGNYFEVKEGSLVSTAEALDAAFEQGGNIVLGADITVSETIVLAEGKTATLDLNGKTLSAADMNVIKNNGGNLTIKNGTVTRTGDVVTYSVNNASGEITIENATIARGLYTSGSKMTANNANISHDQSSRHAIYAWNCEVTINSGTFHNDNAGNATLMAAGSSVVIVNGGTFSIADGRTTLGWTSSMIDQNGTAQVIVKGGLFNGGFRINSANTTLTIEGGEFNTNNGSAFTDYSGTKVVKGGKFTDTGAQNWAKKYIAEGYEMNANGVVVAK